MKRALSRERTSEVIRYTAGCLYGIVIKIAVTAVFTALSAPVWLGYLAAQLVILVFSYTYHSRVTFRRKLHGWREYLRNFLVFAGSVLIFKLADYLLVVLGAGYATAALERSEALTPWMRQGIVSAAIAAGSGIIFFIRYFFYRIIFRKRKEEEPGL